MTGQPTSLRLLDGWLLAGRKSNDQRRCTSRNWGPGIHAFQLGGQTIEKCVRDIISAQNPIAGVKRQVQAAGLRRLLRLWQQAWRQLRGGLAIRQLNGLPHGLLSVKCQSAPFYCDIAARK